MTESSTTRPELHRPLVATDIVLFTGRGKGRRVLLIERKNHPFQGMLAFPGGFLDEGESLEQCAHRELKEETSLDGVLLTELGSFSEPTRDPRGRCISVAYLGIVDDAVAQRVAAGDDAARAGWYVVDTLRPEELAFDHWQMLSLARDRLDDD